MQLSQGQGRQPLSPEGGRPLAAPARRRFRDVWDQMAHTPAAVVWAVGVSLDQSGDGADARGGRGGVCRTGGR